MFVWFHLLFVCYPVCFTTFFFLRERWTLWSFGAAYHAAEKVEKLRLLAASLAVWWAWDSLETWHGLEILLLIFLLSQQERPGRTAQMQGLGGWIVKHHSLALCSTLSNWRVAQEYEEPNIRSAPLLEETNLPPSWCSGSWFWQLGVRSTCRANDWVLQSFNNSWS